MLLNACDIPGLQQRVVRKSIPLKAMSGTMREVALDECVVGRVEHAGSGRGGSWVWLNALCVQCVGGVDVVVSEGARVVWLIWLQAEVRKVVVVVVVGRRIVVLVVSGVVEVSVALTVALVSIACKTSGIKMIIMTGDISLMLHMDVQLLVGV